MANKAQRIVKRSVRCLHRQSAPVTAPIPGAGRMRDQVRRVADYIAGMTDRYAIKEHRRLFTVGES
jgi:dGTPase